MFLETSEFKFKTITYVSYVTCFRQAVRLLPRSLEYPRLIFPKLECLLDVSIFATSSLPKLFNDAGNLILRLAVFTRGVTIHSITQIYLFGIPAYFLDKFYHQLEMILVASEIIIIESIANSS